MRQHYSNMDIFTGDADQISAVNEIDELMKRAQRFETEFS